MDREEIRLACLKQAVLYANKYCTTKRGPTNVIAVAKKFERWVIGKTN